MSPRREIAAFAIVLGALVGGSLNEALFGGKVLSPADLLFVSASFRDVKGPDYEPANRLLTDPVLRHRIGPLVRIVPEPLSVGTVDGVLLSHLHADHADLRSLRGVNRSGPIVAPYPGRTWLSANGLDDVVDLRLGEKIALGDLTVAATPATHDPRRRRTSRVVRYP